MVRPYLYVWLHLKQARYVTDGQVTHRCPSVSAGNVSECVGPIVTSSSLSSWTISETRTRPVNTKYHLPTLKCLELSFYERASMTNIQNMVHHRWHIDLNIWCYLMTFRFGHFFNFCNLFAYL